MTPQPQPQPRAVRVASQPAKFIDDLVSAFLYLAVVATGSLVVLVVYALLAALSDVELGRLALLGGITWLYFAASRVEPV